MKHIVFAAIVLSTTAAHAEKGDPKLHQLVGTWQGTSKFTLQSKTVDFKVKMTCAAVAVSTAVACTLVGIAGTDTRLEEAWLLGRNGASDFHLFTTNNWDEAFDHVGTWTDQASVSFVATSTRDGKPLREEYALTFKAKTLTMHGTQTLDGKVLGDGVTTLERVK